MASTYQYELPVTKEIAYGLVSLCAATYVQSGIRLHPSGEEDPLSVETIQREIIEKLKVGFEQLAWSMPESSALSLLRHRRRTREQVRLGGFAVATHEYIVLVFRGTAYSDEWMANISYAVPAVRSWRQLLGLVTISMVPFLRKRPALRRVFDLENGVAENAAYLIHLEGMLKQVKQFLDRVIVEENANPSLKDRPLYITGHSLGGAASIIIRRRLLSSGQEQYAKTFNSRMITVTFGAPPILAEPEQIESDAPPVYNLIRHNDIVPCLSLDVIRIPIFGPLEVVPELPSTPHHFGDHFLLQVNRKVMAVRRHSFKRGPIFLHAAFQFLVGMFTFKAFQRVAKCHVVGSYAKDMASCLSPNDEEK